MTASKKIAAAQEQVETLNSLLECLGAIEGFDVELSAEDSNEWPIAPWKIEDTDEEEISRVFITVSLIIGDDELGNADSITAEAVALAESKGIHLTPAVEFRQTLRETSTIKLETPNF